MVTKYFFQLLSRNLFYYSMFGNFNATKSSSIAISDNLSFNNKIVFNIAEDVPYEKGLSSARQTGVFHEVASSHSQSPEGMLMSER